MIPISIKLSEEIVEWATKEAKELGVARSTFLKLFIKEAYDNRKNSKFLKS